MKKILHLAGMVLVSHSILGAQGFGNDTWPRLTAKADAVVVGRLLASSGSADGGVSAQIGVLRILKARDGLAVPLELSARLQPSSLMRTHPYHQHNPETIGLWFLRLTDATYEILPTTDHPKYHWEETFFIADPNGPDIGTEASLEERVLAEIIAGYRTVATPWIDYEAERIFKAIGWSPQDIARNQGRKLYADRSMPVSARIAALAGQIWSGLPDAIATLDRDLDWLARDPGFPLIIRALTYNFKSADPAAAGALLKILARRPEVEGLDKAIMTALSRGPRRNALPAYVLMLDSTDTVVQFSAVRGLWDFAMFAREDGEIRGGMGPWASEAVRQQRPRDLDSFLAERDKYVGFWKNWWRSTRAQHGFPEQN